MMEEEKGKKSWGEEKTGRKEEESGMMRCEKGKWKKVRKAESDRIKHP